MSRLWPDVAICDVSLSSPSTCFASASRVFVYPSFLATSQPTNHGSFLSSRITWMSWRVPVWLLDCLYRILEMYHFDMGWKPPGMEYGSILRFWIWSTCHLFWITPMNFYQNKQNFYSEICQRYLVRFSKRVGGPAGGGRDASGGGARGKCSE